MIAARLAGLTLIVACGSVVDTESPRRGAVQFVLTPAPELRAPPGNWISILDTVRLSVTATGSATSLVTQTLRLGRRDTVATFDLSLPDGSYNFTASVISTNGTLLFDGVQSVTIDRDDFVVDLTVQPRTAVLVLVPDTMVVSPAPIATVPFQLHNRGSVPLVWSLVHDANLQTCNCSVLMGRGGGTIPPLGRDTVGVTVRKPATLAIRLTVTSAQGNVTIGAR